MTNQTKRAFVLSSLVHGLGLTGFVMVGLLSNCAEEEPKEIVFTLLASPPPAPVSPPAPTPPRRVTPPPPKPTPPPPKPTPPKPKPTKPKPTKPKPKPTTPKPTPPPPKVNILEFRKQHPLPKPPRPPTPVKIPPSIIDPDKFKVNVSTPKPVVNRDPNELARYLSRAYSKIEREWLRRKEASGLRSHGSGVMEVTAKFEIGAGGELRAPRLARRSTYPELNRLVLQALLGIGNVGRPPYPISDTLTMTFRLN